MHAIEKILARNSGRGEVRTGEIVTAKVDFAEINDLYLQTVYSFYEMGGEKVWDNTRCAFVFDHYAPCPDIKSASNHREMREFAKKNGLKFHFDTDCGATDSFAASCSCVSPALRRRSFIFFPSSISLSPFVPAVFKRARSASLRVYYIADRRRFQ